MCFSTYSRSFRIWTQSVLLLVSKLFCCLASRAPKQKFVIEILHIPRIYLSSEPLNPAVLPQHTVHFDDDLVLSPMEGCVDIVSVPGSQLESILTDILSSESLYVMTMWHTHKGNRCHSIQRLLCAVPLLFPPYPPVASSESPPLLPPLRCWIPLHSDSSMYTHTHPGPRSCPLERL